MGILGVTGILLLLFGFVLCITIVGIVPGLGLGALGVLALHHDRRKRGAPVRG